MTGEKIRALRKKHRYSQRQLAELLEVSQTAVSAWENGTRSLTLETIERISRVLHEPVAEFFDEPYRRQIESNETTVDQFGQINVRTPHGYNSSVDMVLETEVMDYIEEAAQAADDLLLSRLEKVSDKVLLDEIISIFNNVGKIGKFEMYRFAMQMTDMEIPSGRFLSKKERQLIFGDEA